MANLAFVSCLFVLPAVALCQSKGSAPVLRPVSDNTVYGTIGQTISLACETDDESDSFAWYFNNEPIVTETSMRGNLTLPLLQEKDGGWYTCAAANRFGRAERDFLLIVGGPPVEIITFNHTIYRVPVGYPAELPCHYVGTPHPTVQWFDMQGSGGPISSVSNRYVITATTGSLIVYSSGQAETLNFYCTASNMFGPSVRSTNNFTVDFFSMSSLPDPISFPFLNLTNHSKPLTLTCTNLTNPAGSNFSVNWTRNLDPATMSSSNRRNVSESGYYCCQVSSPSLPRSYLCTTILLQDDSSPRLKSIGTVNVSLPLNRNRRVGLLCNGTTSSGYDPPLIEWFDGQNNVMSDVNVSIGTRGLGFLSASGVRVSSFAYTCVGTNSAGRTSTSAAVQYINTCSGSDQLKGGNAEEMRESWMYSGSGARVASVNNENVFVVDYNGTGTPPSISQTLVQPSAFSLAYISGRVRQNGSSGGVATVRILVDGVELKEIGNPRPSLPSWQWISFTFNQQPEYNLTVMLTVEGFSATTAYFDDLCVTFDLPDEEGLATIIIIASTIGAACFIFVILIVVVFCCTCYCCCSGRKKGDARMMKKMSTLIKTKHSAVIKELRGTGGRYTKNPAAKKTTENQVELYAVADPNSEAHVEESVVSYAHPENYASTEDEGQHSSRIPSVVVERPSKSANTSQENGIYTALKRDAIDKDNVYQAPVAHPSSTSLKNLVSDDDDDDDDCVEEEYEEIELGGAGANYVHLLGSSEEGAAGRPSSRNSRPRSPHPEFPPPLPPLETQQIYENSQEIPLASAVNGGFSRNTPTNGGAVHSQSASQVASPTSLQSPQIYVNSQEVVPPSVQLFSTTLQHTSGGVVDITGTVRSASPHSPRGAVPLPLDDDEQQIYENSEDILMEEDVETEIYENDIPGMNQQFPNSPSSNGKQYTNVNS